MDVKKVLMPNGRLATFYCGDDQTWDEIIRREILPAWEEYCNSNWLSSNHEEVYAPERRVKRLLDRLGELITLGADDVESRYKAMSHKVREIPVSECSPYVTDYLYSGSDPVTYEESGHFEILADTLDGEAEKLPVRKKKRSKRTTRFERIEEIARSMPDSRRTWCRVDADNHFRYNGKTYTAPEEMRGYIGDGQMDRILVVETADALRFYDQNVQNMYLAV